MDGSDIGTLSERVARGLAAIIAHPDMDQSLIPLSLGHAANQLSMANGSNCAAAWAISGSCALYPRCGNRYQEAVRRMSGFDPFMDESYGPSRNWSIAHGFMPAEGTDGEPLETNDALAAEWVRQLTEYRATLAATSA